MIRLHQGHQCSETTLTGKIPVSHKYPPGIWTWVPHDKKQTGSLTGPASSIRIRFHVSKNRFKKLKFTRTDLNDESRKILTTVSSHFFKNILLLAIFSYLALLKSLSHRMDIFCWLCYYITLSHYKIDKNKEEKWFSFYKKLKIIFSIYLTRPGSRIWIDPESGSILRF